MAADPRLGTLPWAQHPWPRDDELFVSWLIRFASANTLTPRRLMAFVAHTRVTTVRINALKYHEYLPVFSQISGVPVERLEAMFPDTPQWTPHLTATDVYYRCCPECLSTDEVPYLRVSWNRSDAYICGKHRTPLSSRCSRCDTQWLTHAFQLSDRPRATDLLHCPLPRCRQPVLASSFGTLSPDHGALWLQEELFHPDHDGLATLGNGTRVRRSVLREMIANLPHRPLQQALLPFEVETGLFQDRNVSERSRLSPWLMFAQLLSLPEWFASELLTDLAEDLAEVTVRGIIHPERGRVRAASRKWREEMKQNQSRYAREAALLQLFHLVHDPGVQIIDRTVLRGYGYEAVLQPHSGIFGDTLPFVLHLLD